MTGDDKLNLKITGVLGTEAMSEDVGTRAMREDVGASAVCSNEVYPPLKLDESSKTLRFVLREAPHLFEGFEYIKLQRGAATVTFEADEFWRILKSLADQNARERPEFSTEDS